MHSTDQSGGDILLTKGSLPPTLQLRPATPDDLPRIREMVWNSRLDPTQLRAAQFLVIVQGSSLIACGQLRRFGPIRELGSLVVVPEWRGQGMAAVLIEALLKMADGPVYLECRAELVPFYEKFGFVQLRWRDLPMPLKPKFGLSQLATLVPGLKLAMMAYRG